MSLCAVGLPGCFDAPPEYSVPERIPPLLDEANASPALSELYVVKGTKTDLRIPFRVSPSEEDVQGVFLIDLEPAGGVFLDLDVTTRGDTLLLCGATWTTAASPGCHRITVRASYVGNFGDRFEVNDPSLATEATWFASLQANQQGEPPVDCFPTGSP